MAATEPSADQTIAALRHRLAAAEETLRALVAGEVDAIVLSAADGESRVYKLESEDTPYRRLVERMTEGAALVDLDGLIVYANRHLATLVGVPLERLIGGSLAAWLDEPDLFAVTQDPAGGTAKHREHLLRRADGGLVPVRVGMNVLDEDGSRLHCLVVTDLSEERAQQRRLDRLNAKLTNRLAALSRANGDLRDAEGLLTHRALHDPLTELPNRALYLDRLTQALADATRSGHPVTVYFVDLDGFKRVNDTVGHDAGDQLLCEVAARLRAVVRPGDTVARFAGDEFVVLTPGFDGLPAVVPLADRMLDALHEPPLRGGTVVVSASIGLAISRGGVDAEGLLGEADAAMYHAKRSGGARWELFGSKLREELRHTRSTEAQLRRALAGDGVQVRYQPVVDLDDGRAVGAEALVRLLRHNGSLQGPATFIPTAEESGLVIPLGQRVLEHACLQPLRWQARTGRPWFVSVNVSPRQLTESDLVAKVTAALAAADLPANQLALEITEEAILDIGSDVLDTLDRLRATGVRIGVDDFGTGYASLSYVRHLPLDFIKIDMSFVAGMQHDRRDLAMVEATLALSHRLGLRSIAEGIETTDHWDRLRELGCDQGQGFLFAKPTISDRVGA